MSDTDKVIDQRRVLISPRSSPISLSSLLPCAAKYQVVKTGEVSV